jgi:prephenate dehydrogenase
MFNKEILNVHKTFMEVSNEFNTFVKNKDEEKFIFTIEETAKYF